MTLNRDILGYFRSFYKKRMLIPYIGNNTLNFKLYENV